jgi:DNA-binding transcriptional LysR family regulator
VSIQLKQLEDIVGLRLFEQMGRRKHLTRGGAELAHHVRGVLAQLRQAESAALRLRKEGAGSLDVVSTTTAEYFVPQLLAEFRRSRPGLAVRLTVKNRDSVIRDLADNAVDLAVMGRAPAGSDTVATAFARHPLAIIAAADHRLAHRRRIQLDKLTDEQFFVREHGSGTRDAMEQVFAQYGFEPRDSIEIGTNEAIKQAVMTGFGLGFVSLDTVAAELAATRLRVLPVVGLPVMRQWFVVHRKTKQLSPHAEGFKSHLLAHGAKRPASAP